MEAVRAFGQWEVAAENGRGGRCLRWATAAAGLFTRLVWRETDGAASSCRRDLWRIAHAVIRLLGLVLPKDGDK